MKKPDIRSMKNNPTPTAQTGIDPVMLAQAQEVMEQFQGKDETALISQLQQAAEKEMRAGNLDNRRLDDIAGILGPMLNPDQFQQMQALLGQLKK